MDDENQGKGRSALVQYRTNSIKLQTLHLQENAEGKANPINDKQARL